MARRLKHLLDPSGGLVYHWRALRYRQALWQPFVAQVAAWLASWQPPQRELVIVGPSAGYTLNAAFLARFDRVTVLEPDPLARWLLQRRFAAIRFEYAELDCLGGLEGLQMLAASFPHAALLFSNVLGQKLADLPAAWPTALQRAMQGHSWASYHDVMASARAPMRTEAREMKAGETLEEVLAGFWSAAGGELEIFDHGSFGRLPAQAHAAWSLTPQQHHLVAWSSIRVEDSSSMLPNTGIGGRS
jgi:hypothetical protein